MIKASDFNIIALILFLCTIFCNIGPGAFRKIRPEWTIVLFLFVIISSVFSVVGADKFVYIRMFEDIFSGAELGHDYGWTVWTKFCYKLFGGSSDLFFATTSLVYMAGFVAIGKMTCGRQYLWYFLTLSFLTLGFFSGLTNIIRSGFATSICYIAYTQRKHYIIAVIMVLAAACVHMSVLLLVGAFVVTSFVKEEKLYVAIWIIFVILSWTNSLSEITDFIINNLGESDERVERYMNATDMTAGGTYLKTGFRIDFILYSAFPIFIGMYYIFKKRFNDSTYGQIFNIYLTLNSFWFLAIRMPYCERFALFSWNLLPTILLYPYFHHCQGVNKGLVIATMCVPVSVTVFLSLIR